VIGTGDLVDDETLDQMNDSMLGVKTTFQYSVAHPSEMNKAFVESMKRFNAGTRPNHMAVAAYDGMRLIYDGRQRGWRRPHRGNERKRVAKPARSDFDRP
jgi:branched-chain amino acid transport system substrate-binding protein